MRKVFIELCRARPAWRSLSKQARREFLSEVDPLMLRLKEQGVEIISWGVNDSTTPKRAAYDFFAIFRFPDEEAALRYERTFENSGWYEYFEQVNIMGADSTHKDVLEELIAL